jgi:peroxiredoxin
MENPSRSSRWLPLVAALLAFGAAVVAQGAPQAQPWYADGLRKLGFTVFPKPVPIDDFEAQALGGPSIKLSSLRGKIVLLNFWATWCPPCRAEMPAIQALWEKTKDKAFTVMGISLGEAEGTVKEFISKHGYGYPVFLDPTGELGAAFNARSIPTTYLIDKSGKAIAGIIGGAPYDDADSIALFARLAAGE